MDVEQQSPIERYVQEHKAELTEAILQEIWRSRGMQWLQGNDGQHEKSRRDIEYHLNYLVQAVEAGDVKLFVDYARWVKITFDALEFPPDSTHIVLHVIHDVLEVALPPAQSADMLAYLQAGMESIQDAPSPAPSPAPQDAPLQDLTRQYVTFLLNNDRHGATKLILDNVEDGASIRDIYLHVFQTAQHEIGHLWQTNQITVAQEHYCTAATQMIMSQLYPYIFSTNRNGRRLVAASISGELHEVGVRMVTDFFEMEGWDTVYLGANMPTDDIIHTVREQVPDILAISATMTPHIRRVADLINRVRDATDSTRILVGGYPFNVAPDLWQRVAADGYAGNALDAIQVGNRLLEASPS